MRLRRHAKALILIGLLGMVAAHVTGCSAGETPAAGKEVTAQDGARFEGAWAAEFAKEYERSEDPAVREALSDGNITDAELQMVSEALRSCTVPLGIEIQEIPKPDEIKFSYNDAVGSSARANELMDDCLERSGYSAVSYLYGATRENPANEDQREDFVACLIRLGVVREDFTLRDYESAQPHEWYVVSEDEGDVALDKCYSDPKGARK